jgi:hypothetical protein
MGLRILHLRRGTVSLKRDSENPEEFTLILLVNDVYAAMQRLADAKDPSYRN